jgi:hypothetical protein
MVTAVKTSNLTYYPKGCNCANVALQYGEYFPKHNGRHALHIKCTKSRLRPALPTRICTCEKLILDAIDVCRMTQAAFRKYRSVSLQQFCVALIPYLVHAINTFMWLRNVFRQLFSICECFCAGTSSLWQLNACVQEAVTSRTLSFMRKEKTCNNLCLKFLKLMLKSQL